MKKEMIVCFGFAFLIATLPLLTGLTRTEVMLMIIVTLLVYKK